MAEEFDRQAVLDQEHLKLLSWGYYISAGMSAFFSLFGLFYILMGTVMGAAFSKMAQEAAKPGQMPPAFIGWIFGGIGAVVFVLMITVAVLKFLTGRNIARRKSRTFCMVIAALNCLELPYGTLLGVLTFVVLGRESVARMFGAAR